MTIEKELMRQKELYFSMIETYKDLLTQIVESDNLEDLKNFAKDELNFVEDWDK